MHAGFETENSRSPNFHVKAGWEQKPLEGRLCPTALF
jgi:hypothetical protein